MLMSDKDKIYFKRKTKKPHAETLNNGHGNRGYIQFTDDLISPDQKIYNGYIIEIWDGRAWFDSVKNQVLLTLDDAKDFLQKEYGGTWKFSEKDITR